jgi:hypothetical protein
MCMGHSHWAEDLGYVVGEDKTMRPIRFKALVRSLARTDALGEIGC